MSESEKNNPIRLYTLGHSDLSFEVFVERLRKAGIHTLVDIRSIPSSKHVPHFNRAQLAERLPEYGITYHHIKELGGKGRRSPRRSPNSGLPKAWQGYADYLQTEEFERGLNQLLALAALGTVAVCCAEADWKKCHRQFLADVLQVRGIKVIHLGTEGVLIPHAMTPGIEIKKLRVTYPAPGEQLSLF